MKYYTCEGSYVWENDFYHPKRNPVCIFDGIDPEWGEAAATALNIAYIKGFEAGVWSPDEPEEKGEAE